MLLLNDDDPAYEDVPLGQGASIRLRPATSPDVYRIQGEVATLVQGVIAGAASIAQLVAIFGAEFEQADLLDPAWQSALSRRFTTLKLTMICGDGWAGVGEKNGVAAEFNEANVARLLRDATIAGKIEMALNRQLHAWSAEGNGSAALPNGGAAKDANTAPIAAPQASPAPQAVSA